MNQVYVVQHLREDPDGYDDVKFIGVYSTKERAEEAVDRIRQLPGFAEVPLGFDIQLYKLDVDHWTEGFTDVSKS